MCPTPFYRPATGLPWFGESGKCEYLRVPKNRTSYKMIDLNFRYRRIISLILSASLVLGIFTSCQKGPVDVQYVFGVVTEITSPGDVKDPDLHEAYLTILGELNNDLAVLMDHTASPFLGEGATFTRIEGVELNPKDLRSEDEKRIAVANSHLLRLKQIESSYKERIEKIEKRTGTSLCIKVHYLLVRGRENSNSVLLQEYHFELKYN
jgi:hypothetical protein